VFPSPASKTGHTVEPTKDWNTLLERAGIENFRIHDLRRTLASYMAVTGTPELIISAMLGHAAATVTGIYARLNVAPVRDAMETAVRYMLKHSTLDQESKIIPFTG